MASQPELSNTNSFRVTRRDKDDLSDQVKRYVRWRIDQPSGPGYYILNQKNHKYIPLKFIYDHWYQLCVYTGDTYISEDAKVLINTKGTGYWHINDYKHSDNWRQRDSTRHISAQAVEAIHFKYSEELYIAEKEAEDQYTRLLRVPTPPLTLTIDTGASLATDPTISRFITTSAATLSPFVAVTATSSPSFTEPHQAEGEKSESTETLQSSTTDKPSSEQEGQEEPVLEAQIEHVLDVQKRESENSYTLDEPVFQQLVKFAVHEGLPIPPPPPLIQPPALAALMAQLAANVQTGWLWGEPPDFFTRDRIKSETFKWQFRMYKGLNANHEIMQSPYLCTMLALTFIKGPLVEDWATN